MSIKIEKLTKIYNNQKVLSDISFKAENGKILGIIGPNGAGKSTLFKIIINAEKADSGQICILEDEPVGFLIENAKLYDNMSVNDNLSYLKALYDTKNDLYIDELINRLDIKKFINKKCKDLSVGMRQRVGILIALLNDSKNVILDEPTSGLDIFAAESIKKIVLELREQGKCVLVSSHLLEEINLICDEIIILNKGEIVKHTDDGITKEDISNILKRSE